MTTRDFDNVPSEEQIPSDIDSEKDAFNDETFGVDISDLEGNEFDFTSTTRAETNTNVNFPSHQNFVTKYAAGHNMGADDSGDSDEMHAPTQLHRHQQQTHQQWSKPLSQRNEDVNSFNNQSGYDSRFVKGPVPSLNRGQGDFYRVEPGEYEPQPRRDHQQRISQPQGIQSPFRLNFAALSLSTRDQQQYHNYNNGPDESGNQPRHNRNEHYQRRDDFQQRGNNFFRDSNREDQNGQNISFQPFSFTGSGYRRPQWDDGEDNGGNSPRRFYNNGNGNSNQPRYFQNNNNRQQNWQIRAGEYHNRRFDNTEYEDRDRERGHFQQRGEYRRFERRGPHDPWAGLMTWREKLTVLRIQLLQIIADRGSNVDDYYARKLTEKRREASVRLGVDSLSIPHQQNLGESDEASSRNDRRRTISQSNDGTGNQNNNRNRIPIPRLSVVDVQPYKPMAFQNALGKWTATTVTRPRQILDTSSMNLDELQESGGKKGESAAKLLIQALGSVERLYDFVLSAEDFERLLKMSPEQLSAPPPDLVPEGASESALRIGSFQSTNQPKPVNPEDLEADLVSTRRNIAETLCAPTRLALILAIKKGRKVLPRAIKVLDRGRFYAENFELSLQLASILCEHLPLLIRRETNSAALVAVVTPLCSFVRSVMIARSAYPAAMTDDFLFTVRAILADKALSTRSPELVTLLASLVSVRK